MKSYKTRKQMADALGVGTGDTWVLSDETFPFIDSQVRPIVKKLNEQGITTYFSCQGHPGKQGWRYYCGHIVYDTNKRLDDIFRKEGFNIRRNTLKDNPDFKEKKVSIAELDIPYNLERQKKIWKKVYLDIVKEGESLK